MRRTWAKVSSLAMVLLMVIGFWTVGRNLQSASHAEEWWEKFSPVNWWKKEPNLKPPPHPEELIKPPADDPRFSKPIAYPEDSLNKDAKIRPKSEGRDKTSPHFGGGGSMGGGGY